MVSEHDTEKGRRVLSPKCRSEKTEIWKVPSALNLSGCLRVAASALRGVRLCSDRAANDKPTRK